MRQQPGVALRCAWLDGALDRVEVEGQGERGQADREDRDADAEGAGAADAERRVRDQRVAEVDQREDHVAEDRHRHHAAEPGGDLDQPHLVGQQHPGEHREGGQHGLGDDPLVASGVDGADGPDEQTLDHGIHDDQRNADGLLERDGEAEHEGQGDPTEQQHRPDLRREDPADRCEDEHQGEQPSRLHHDVVEGQATGLDGAGCGPLVEVLQLAVGHRAAARPP